AEGPLPITKRLDQLGYRDTLWMLPGVRHNTMRTTAAGMLEWALEQRRVRHPSQVTFAAYFPYQGRAHWTEIAGVSPPGFLAKLDARATAGNRITVWTTNASRIALYPDSCLVDPARPVTVSLDGRVVYSSRCRPDSRIECSFDRGRWTARASEVTPSA